MEPPNEDEEPRACTCCDEKPEEDLENSEDEKKEPAPKRPRKNPNYDHRDMYIFFTLFIVICTTLIILKFLPSLVDFHI